MTIHSDNLAATVLSLITEYGEAITLTRTSEGAYNSATGTTGAATTTTYTGYGVPEDYQAREIDGEIIQRSDSRLYVNAISTTPVPGDTVTLASGTIRIINIYRYVVNAVNVLYELQIRK